VCPSENFKHTPNAFSFCAPIATLNFTTHRPYDSIKLQAIHGRLSGIPR
jgi:hypothetical protein